MEVHAGEGVLRFFKYIADRTDIAIGHVQLGVIGIRADPAEMAEIYHRDPGRGARSRRAYMDTTVPTAGAARAGA